MAFAVDVLNTSPTLFPDLLSIQTDFWMRLSGA